MASDAANLFSGPTGAGASIKEVCLEEIMSGEVHSHHGDSWGFLSKAMARPSQEERRRGGGTISRFGDGLRSKNLRRAASDPGLDFFTRGKAEGAAFMGAAAFFDEDRV